MYTNLTKKIIKTQVVHFLCQKKYNLPLFGQFFRNGCAAFKSALAIYLSNLQFTLTTTYYLQPNNLMILKTNVKVLILMSKKVIIKCYMYIFRKQVTGRFKALKRLIL